MWASPIATAPRCEGLIGFFVNTLALRTDLAGNPSFRELLGRVREVRARRLRARRTSPSSAWSRSCGRSAGSSHAPLFQVMFAVDGEPPRPVAGDGLVLRPEAIPSGTAKFDLTLVVEDAGGAWRGYCEYARDLFSAATVQRLVGHWSTLLAAVAGMAGDGGEPGRRVSELPLLTAGERHQLVAEWGQGAAPVVRGDVVSGFAASVAHSPEATAVIGFPSGPQAGER